MTTRILTAAILVLTIISCSDSRIQDNPKQETPNALEDKSSSYELVTKRSGNDLVEDLYDELVRKDIGLKKLEDIIDDLNVSKNDTTKQFEKFNEKNQSYFSSANRHISEIRDSLLREKMKNLIETNLTRYNTATARHNELLKMIAAKNLTISDLHTILKIVKTLQLMEQYQKENLPGTKSIEGYIKRQNETIKYIDTLTKK